MGGVIDWAALPLLCEIYGVEDVEMFISQLALLRDEKR